MTSNNVAEINYNLHYESLSKVSMTSDNENKVLKQYFSWVNGIYIYI